MQPSSAMRTSSEAKRCSATLEPRQDQHGGDEHDRCVRNTARRLLRALKKIALVLLWLFVATLATVFLGMLKGSIHFYAILTGSMRPTMPPGTAIVVHPEPVSRIRVGQVIVANLPRLAKSAYRQYAHRIIWIAHRGLDTLVRTKGDANRLPDRWTLVFHGGTVQHEWLSMPMMGYLAAPGDHRYVWFALLVAAVVLFDAWAIRWVLTRYAYEVSPVEHSRAPLQGNDAVSLETSGPDGTVAAGELAVASGDDPMRMATQ
ncbi:MAG: signal peptidase I [Acidimicrobiales bacterium]